MKSEEQCKGATYPHFSDRSHLVSLPIKWRHIDKKTKSLALAPNRDSLNLHEKFARAGLSSVYEQYKWKEKKISNETVF